MALKHSIIFYPLGRFEAFISGNPKKNASASVIFTATSIEGFISSGSCLPQTGALIPSWLAKSSPKDTFLFHVSYNFPPNL